MFEAVDLPTKKEVQITVNRLDILDSNELLNGVQKLIEESTKDIELNLKELDFIDSAVLGVFVRLNEKAKESGIGLTFTKLSPFIRNLFKNSKTDVLFNIK